MTIIPLQISLLILRSNATIRAPPDDSLLIGHRTVVMGEVFLLGDPLQIDDGPAKQNILDDGVRSLFDGKMMHFQLGTKTFQPRLRLDASLHKILLSAVWTTVIGNS